ncbi:venom dipeptidyl peptidase 4 isoform X3 [Vespula squamosa]|uniref:Venom dipeptidyl peptidase 4 isoform X3 n=1 Tax=Vespula squamosa TaxID=30214 RepID=A0ABD1ZX53_VESSQ
MLYTMYIDREVGYPSPSVFVVVNVKDLMTKNKRTNWRRLLAGGLVAIVALALVVAAAILLTGSPDSSASRTTNAPGISLEEWLTGSLSPKSFNATWLSECFESVMVVVVVVGAASNSTRREESEKGVLYAGNYSG